VHVEGGEHAYLFCLLVVVLKTNAPNQSPGLSPVRLDEKPARNARAINALELNWTLSKVMGASACHRVFIGQAACENHDREGGKSNEW